MTDNDSAQVLLNLESTIKSHIAQIDKNKIELKKNRELLKSALLNDETYRVHSEDAKKTAKTRMQTKFQILQQSSNKQVSDRIKEQASEIRELNTALSDYLREYQRMSGSDEIEMENGESFEIVYVAKLVKKK